MAACGCGPAGDFPSFLETFAVPNLGEFECTEPEVGRLLPRFDGLMRE